MLLWPAIGLPAGHKVTIVMPEMAEPLAPRQIENMGGKVMTFDGTGSWKGLRMIRAMAAKDPSYFLPCQHDNPLGVAVHEFGTGEEILKKVDGPIDALVARYGTGAMAAGLSRSLRWRDPSMQVYSPSSIQKPTHPWMRVSLPAPMVRRRLISPTAARRF